MTLHVGPEPDDEQLAQSRGRRARRPARDAACCAAGQVRGAGAGDRRRRAAARDRGRARSQRLFDETAALLEGVAGAVDVHGALARDAGALGDHAEADDLRPDRRHSSPRRPPGCRSRSAGSATGTTATPGSGTPRSRSTPCSAWGSPRRRRPSAAGCATASRSRPAATRRPAQHHVPGRRLLRPRPRRRSSTGRATGAPRPVRIGNGAAGPAAAGHLRRGDGQHLLRRPARPPDAATRAGWRSATCSTGSCDNWDQPEEGIWETRGGRKDFTYGRLMSWVAFDRGIRLAAEHGRPAPVERWTAERDAIYDQVMERGLEHRAAGLRAALRRPGARLLAAADGDGRVHLAARPDVALDAGRDGRRAGHRQPRLPLRPGGLPDGLRGSEGTFSLCTFTYVDALARAGRLDEARLDVREDADLRQPPRPVLRGDRASPASSSATSRRRSPTSP